MKTIAPCFVFLLFLPTGQAIEISEAYRLIPHTQIPFHNLQSNMPDVEAKYVSKLLTLSELAMVERVEAMTDGKSKKTVG